MVRKPWPDIVSRQAERARVLMVIFQGLMIDDMMTFLAKEMLQHQIRAARSFEISFQLQRIFGPLG